MEKITTDKLDDLLAEVRHCNLCARELPHPPNPVLRAGAGARILIIGQAPGTRVHATGIPWNDASGKRLRDWMGVSAEQFYNEQDIAIVPMGFCYPGKGGSGDLPPRPECATRWHQEILQQLPDIRLTLLIGQYAQNYYLPGSYASLTSRVRDWRLFIPRCFVLPHPSPRNQLWLKRNAWFEAQVIPALRQAVKLTLLA